ncbi:MAG: zinc ribbon domain-containing protein [Calothrix sp. MO_192.B10]|nr:zinc ribbon domain-containing protein [Calothrix sp. MO_192.B10]
MSVRTYICRCGCTSQRDHNAALNILNLARQATFNAEAK